MHGFKIPGRLVTLETRILLGCLIVVYPQRESFYLSKFGEYNFEMASRFRLKLCTPA